MEDRRSVGSILLSHKQITQQALDGAIAVQQHTNEPLLKILIDQGFINDDIKAQVLAEQWHMPFVDVMAEQIEADVLALVDQERAKRYGFVAFKREEGVVSIALSDPTNIELMDYLLATYGRETKFFVAPKNAIYGAIEKYYVVGNSIKEASSEAKTEIVTEAGAGDEVSIEQLREMGQDAPVIRLVNTIITQAIVERASDIHVEPQKDHLRVRYRVDGILLEKQKLPRNIQAGVLSRIKIMSNMDIAERRKPQDGRISLRIDNKAIDFRVSSLPTIYGEKIVMRILDKSSAMVPLENLGFLNDTLSLFNNVISQPYGMIIISGPTGAGKTTTLYSVLNRLNMPGKNIVTVEDPVEYQMDGLNQVQVNVKADMTFANGLRSILRQDPNIILIGEIRDGETAQIAIESALTGHLVLSTLHTNDAPSVATRLIDMGIEPFLIASSLIGATAQRLARKICPDCKQPYVPPASALEGLGLSTRGKLEDVTFYKGAGCAKCGGSGYRGRTGIHEMMRVDDELRRLILHKASARDISQAARSHGMRTLLEDALVKAREGIITLEEVLRVVSTVESD
ncbi:MAG: GspE/PulE family protein [Candidatus Cryosericum sp.]